MQCVSLRALMKHLVMRKHADNVLTRSKPVMSCNILEYKADLHFVVRFSIAADIHPQAIIEAGYTTHLSSVK